jgi:copper oxidase (laccase) domain-containing protein
MLFQQDAILTPAIFEGVKRVKSVFTLVGERVDENPLGNNMSVVDGVVRDGLKLAGVPEDELDIAVTEEIERTYVRRVSIAHSIGFLSDFVSSPKPVQGIEIVDVNLQTISDLRLNSPTRRSADAAIITAAGFANLIAPADCPVYDIVDPNKFGLVAQGHAGHEGIRNGAPFALLDEMIERGLKPEHALVNIHPNATQGFELKDRALDEWLLVFGGMFLDVVDGRSFIDMTAAVVWQMIQRGIREDRIQTSKTYSDNDKDLNSLTDPQFYSHRAKAQKGFNGRNAAILGLVCE